MILLVSEDITKVAVLLASFYLLICNQPQHALSKLANLSRAPHGKYANLCHSVNVNRYAWASSLSVCLPVPPQKGTLVRNYAGIHFVSSKISIIGSKEKYACSREKEGRRIKKGKKINIATLVSVQAIEDNNATCCFLLLLLLDRPIQPFLYPLILLPVTRVSIMQQPASSLPQLTNIRTDK